MWFDINYKVHALRFVSMHVSITMSKKVKIIRNIDL